ncbi:MAG: DNA recombination protein RmuC [Elusimicrobia bacterium]|nr:DNA recombination protein RmuC [Elusimicrobiota bacterium]
MNSMVVVWMVLGVAGLGLGVLLWKILAQLQATQVQGQALQLMQAQMESLRGQMAQSQESLRTQLAQNQNSMDQRLDNAARVFGELQKQLGGLNQLTQQVKEFYQETTKGLTSLQAVFQPPKMRGGVGEVLLAALLADVLPRETYELQYTFKSGDKVDALIKLPEGFVPVDAKFPLENFKKLSDASEERVRNAAKREFLRDVKKHIEDISSKYILPDEGTLDFALMYIPAGNVYYEIILKGEEGEKELYQYGVERRVIPVSPNAFYAYLMALVRGFRGMKIAQKAQEILRHLDRLHGDLGRFGEDFSKVGKHLSNAQNAFSEAEKRLTRFEDKLGTLKEGAPPVLPSKEQSLLPE